MNSSMVVGKLYMYKDGLSSRRLRDIETGEFTLKRIRWTDICVFLGVVDQPNPVTECDSVIKVLTHDGVLGRCSYFEGEWEEATP